MAPAGVLHSRFRDVRLLRRDRSNRNAQRLHHTASVDKRGSPFGESAFVERFARRARLVRNLRDTLHPRYIAEAVAIGPDHRPRKLLQDRPPPTAAWKILRRIPPRGLKRFLPTLPQVFLLWQCRPPASGAPGPSPLGPGIARHQHRPLAQSPGNPSSPYKFSRAVLPVISRKSLHWFQTEQQAERRGNSPLAFRSLRLEASSWKLPPNSFAAKYLQITPSLRDICSRSHRLSS